jgi:hypothetical protein
MTYEANPSDDRDLRTMKAIEYLIALLEAGTGKVRVAGINPAEAGEAAVAAGTVVAGVAGAAPKTLADLWTLLGTPAKAGEAGTAATSIRQAILGTGLPIPLVFADPAGDGYTAAQVPGRACARLRVLVGNSGVAISLDGGTTASISLPPNSMDDIAVALAADTSIKVKRYTPGVAMTDLIIEVR